ncbi:hypothetical protein D3C86_861280 [compost metagenome]
MFSEPLNEALLGKEPKRNSTSELGLIAEKKMFPVSCPFADTLNEVGVNAAEAALTASFTGVDGSKLGKLNSNSCS